MSLPSDIWFTIVLDLIVEHLCDALTGHLTFRNPLPSLLCCCKASNYCTAQAVRTILAPCAGQIHIMRDHPDQDGYNILAKLLAVASLAHNDPAKRRPRNRLLRDLRPLAKSSPFVATWTHIIDLIAKENQCTIPNYALPPPMPPFRIFTPSSIRTLARIIFQLPSPVRTRLDNVTQYASIRAAAWYKINTIANDVTVLAALIQRLAQTPHALRPDDIQRIPSVIETYEELMRHSERFHARVARRYHIEPSQVPDLDLCELALLHIDRCKWDGLAMQRTPDDARRIWSLAQNYVLSRFSYGEIAHTVRRYVCWRFNGMTWPMDANIWVLP